MRGHDPRDFALFAYGGAGPLHAALGRRRARLPPRVRAAHAGQLLGLRSPRRRRASRLCAHPRGGDGGAAFRGAPRHPRRDARGGPAERSPTRASRPRTCASRRGSTCVTSARPSSFRLQYPRRPPRWPTSTPPSSLLTRSATPMPCRARPRSSPSASPPTASSPSRRCPWTRRAAASPRHAAASGRSRLRGVFMPTPVYERARLPRHDAGSTGPAIVEDAGASTLVPPDFSTSLDAFGNLVLERRRA